MRLGWTGSLARSCVGSAFDFSEAAFPCSLCGRGADEERVDEGKATRSGRKKSGGVVGKGERVCVERLSQLRGLFLNGENSISNVRGVLPDAMII